MPALRWGVVFVALAAEVGAQTVWQQLAVTPPTPSGLAGAALGSAPNGGTRVPRLILFGGQTGSGLSNDTWILDNGAWNRQVLSLAPSPRAGITMDGYAMLFGGFDGQNYLNDTWRYEVPWYGTAGWREIRPSGPLPPGRAYHAQAVCVESVYIHGGSDAQNVLGDGWVLPPGGSWQPLPPGPSARTGHEMAWMPQRTDVELVMFGGVDASGVALGDTWVFQNGSWSLQSPTVQPPARFGHVLAADYLRGCLVMYGGMDSSGRLYRDVWEWDGSDWRQSTVSGGPSARWGHAASYDFRLEKVVVIGGVGKNDTWDYGTAFPPRTIAFDSGCGFQGTLTTPVMWGVAGAWIGGPLTVGSSFQQGGSPSVVALFGVSKTRVPLVPFGGAGCMLVSPDLVIPGQAGPCCPYLQCAGTYCSDTTIQIPAVPSLAGRSVFAQVIDIGQPTSPRLLSTNGLEFVLGWR